MGVLQQFFPAHGGLARAEQNADRADASGRVDAAHAAHARAPEHVSELAPQALSSVPFAPIQESGDAQAEDAETSGPHLDTAALDTVIRERSAKGSWPLAIRQNYARATVARQKSDHQFLFVLGFLVAVFTIALDFMIHPESAVTGAWLRAFTIIPITVVGLVAGARGWHWIMSVCVGAAPIAFAVIMVYLGLQMSAENTARYLTATALIVGIANIILPYSMRQLLAFNAAFITGAFGTVILTSPQGYVAYFDYLFLLCVVTAATVPLAYRIERLRQRNFLLNLRASATSRELTLANRALRELSERDPLTGMANRRYFEQAFAKKIALADKADDAGTMLSRGRIAVMMIDLDSFKMFNDTNGHQAGDQCLLLVARALQRVFSDSDGIVARYGGEEFVAAIRERTPGDAARLAEEVRETVATMKLPANVNSASRITTSVGVALSPAAKTLPREDLIEMADAALYNAKRGGRDRVEVVEVEKPLRLSA